MRLVTLEEHFTTHKFQDAMGPAAMLANRQSEITARLLDIGEGRIQRMDDAGIDYQILSFNGFGLYDMPSDIGIGLARDANIQNAEAMKAYPDRFGGFASLPLQEPEYSAKELEFCVETLGFVGAMIDGTVGGRFLDDERFTPVFEMAVRLDVPIYLHPCPPPSAVRRAYTEDLKPPFNFLLSTSAWGWHVETGLHALRMMIGGVFDRFPTLKVILGHLGENLPFSIVRANTVLCRAGLQVERKPLEVFKENFWVTTSGYFSVAPMLCTREVLGSDRILLSVDYPFSELECGGRMLEDLKTHFSADEIEGFAYRNATNLLRL